MAEDDGTAVWKEQLQLLRSLARTLASRAQTGTRQDLDDLLTVQTQIAHVLQALAGSGDALILEDAAPAPAAWSLRQPAPPLPHEDPLPEPDEEQTRAAFPPMPAWAADLEYLPDDERDR